jgi:hypothetical protein
VNEEEEMEAVAGELQAMNIKLKLEEMTGKATAVL